MIFAIVSRPLSLTQALTAPGIPKSHIDHAPGLYGVNFAALLGVVLRTLGNEKEPSSS